MAIAHVGHGVTSYFLTYQAVLVPVALFAQTGWGGVYLDSAEQTAELAAQFGAIAEVLDLAESGPEIARVGHRLVVAESGCKGIDICTWLELDGQRQPGLAELRRTDRRPTALARAARRLDPGTRPRGTSGNAERAASAQASSGGRPIQGGGDYDGAARLDPSSEAA